MDYLFFYILASVAGGLVAEINSKNGILNRDIKPHFVRGFTSVVIGIIFGLFAEWLTQSARLATAVSCLAGVSGYPSIKWIGELAKGKAERLFKK